MVGQQLADDGYPDDWYVPGQKPAADGYPEDWYVPAQKPAADGYPDDWFVPGQKLAADGYPDDWFVPGQRLADDGYPDDWIVPGQTGTPDFRSLDSQAVPSTRNAANSAPPARLPDVPWAQSLPHRQPSGPGVDAANWAIAPVLGLPSPSTLMTPVSDRTETMPRWIPMGPGTGWEPWADHFIKGMRGLINFFARANLRVRAPLMIRTATMNGNTHEENARNCFRRETRQEESQEDIETSKIVHEGSSAKDVAETQSVASTPLASYEIEPKLKPQEA